MLKVYHYPNCSTCKRARKWLEVHGIDHELVDIVERPPSKRALQQAARRAGLPVAKLFNTSGNSYREGGFKDRLASMSDDEAFAALCADGKLIKRPLVLGEDVALVGFREEAYAEALG